MGSHNKLRQPADAGSALRSLFVSNPQTWPHPDIQADLALLRSRAPLTHCLTNFVVAGFTANVLLALGASPAMVIAEEEAAELAALAGGVLINLGTITAASAQAMQLAAASAAAAGTPWVLDPVAVGVLAFRTGVATSLLRHRPAVIRGNASEILALSGAQGAGKGVDSTAPSSAAVDAARALAGRTGAVVAVSGATDYVTDGIAMVEVPGGDPIMTRVTGIGCSLGGVMAAFLGAGVPRLRAAIAASAVFAHAAERAVARSRGTGGFAAAFLDELSVIGARAA
jgi:hydroxyethylthiazole kinase